MYPYTGGPFMRFMLLIYLDEKSLTRAEYEECYGKSVALAQDLQASGKFLATAPFSRRTGPGPCAYGKGSAY